MLDCQVSSFDSCYSNNIFDCITQVRWADLEEKKHMEHRRRIGFCIGTDWSILTDPYAKIPEH